MNARGTNQVALVTGATTGIGKAIALRLAQDGFVVLVHYGHREAEAASVLDAIRRTGGNGEVLGADLASTRGVKELAEKVGSALRTMGKASLDVLVNNAGIQTKDGLSQIDEVDFDSLVAVNVKAPFFLVRTLRGTFANGARIVNISSGLSQIAFPEKIAYAMTKAAINAFTKSLAKELGARGITVNAVGPGVTNTEMNARWLASPEGRARVASLSPLNRVGEASDVADVVASLVSKDGRWITGSYVDASGGSLLG